MGRSRAAAGSVLSTDESLHESLSERLATTGEETTTETSPSPLTFRQPADPDPAGPWPSEHDGTPLPGDDESAGRDPSPTSSPASSASGKPVATKTVMRNAAREGVAMVTTAAHELTARDEPAREAGVWLADEEDQRAIGDPLANMAGRRSMLSSAANPDVVDAIAAGIGLVVYLGKQLTRFRQVRAARAERAKLEATIPDTDTGEDLSAVSLGGPAPSSDPAGASWG